MRPSRLLPLIVACALFIENMDSTVIATSLPAMALDLGTSPIALKLAMTTYLIALAVFLPVSGWVADTKGSRATFVGAIVVFLLGSWSCALASSLETLVVARAVQGLGGALMVPVGRLVILRAVPKAELVDAMGWLTVPALVAPIVGPPVGGFITTYFDWRWIFLLNLPVGVIGIGVALRFLPDVREAVGPLDVRGFALSGVGLALTLFGFSTMGKHLVATDVAVSCGVAGVACLVGYAFHARAVERARRAALAADPSCTPPRALLDLALFRLPTFRASVVGGGFFRVGVGATPFLLPLMLQLGFGLSPLQSGLLTFASAVGAMFSKSLASTVLRRFGFKSVLVVDAVFASCFLAAYGLFRADTPHVVVYGVLIAGGSLRALQFTALNAVAFADVDAARMGQATSLSGMFQQLSLSVGVAVGGYALQLFGVVRGVAATDVENFGPAFFVVGFCSLQSVWWFLSLPKDAGAALARRSIDNPGCESPATAQAQTRRSRARGQMSRAADRLRR